MVEQADEIGHQALVERPAGLPQLMQILDPADELARVRHRIIDVDRERPTIRRERFVGVVEPAVVDRGDRDRDIANIGRLALFVVEIALVAKEDNLVLEQDLVDRADGLVRQVTR